MMKRILLKAIILLLHDLKPAFTVDYLIKTLREIAPEVSIFYNDRNVPNQLTGISIGAFFSPDMQLFKGKAKEGESFAVISYEGDAPEDIKVEKATFLNGRWHINQGNRVVDYDETLFDLMAYIPGGGATGKGERKGI